MQTAFFAGKGSGVSEETISVIAGEIRTLQTKQGRYERYAYKVTENADGTTSLVLLDVGEVLYTRLRLAYASIGVGFIGMLITVILVVALSKKAVKPEIKQPKTGAILDQRQP